MKRLLSLGLALLLCVSCFAMSVSAQADMDKGNDVIYRIDSFLDLHEVFNDCESHYIGDAEFIANPNSSAIGLDMVEDPITEGSFAALFYKLDDRDLDMPMMVRSGSDWYINSFDYIEFDMYLTEGMKLKERTADSWATIKFQSIWTNNVDDECVYSVKNATDLVYGLKAGQWNHVRIPLPQNNDQTFRQFNFRIGTGCFDAAMGEGVVMDNFLLTATGEREMEIGDEGDLNALKADYDALTDEEKALVTNADTLDALLAQMADVKAAYMKEVQDVIDMIDALPDPKDVTEDDEMDIVDAEIALSELGYSQAKLVTNRDKLSAVREAFNNLGNAPQAKRGDVDGDGNVAAADALLILKAVVGKAQLTAQEAAAADLDGDGNIAAADALVVLKIVVGKE